MRQEQPELSYWAGKYTVLHESGLNLRAERYGEPWIQGFVTGESLILAMAQRIEELELAILQTLKATMKDPVCRVCDGTGIAFDGIKGINCDNCGGRGSIYIKGRV